MQETIPEITARRPHTIVLIDEVESFAVRRNTASFDTNPVDVHRATDAVLQGIDAVSQDLPSIVFVTTTNFIEAVDEAFLSRADLVMRFTLPDQTTIVSILRHSLEELAANWPPVKALLENTTEIEELASHCVGWDGRRVRKLVLAALAQRIDVARDPGQLTMGDLRAAVKHSDLEVTAARHNRISN
jgi:AAA+ superfamily predicted ATPase